MSNDAAKSVSAETTFFDDISRYDDLVAHPARPLAKKVSARLKKGRHRRPDRGAEAQDRGLQVAAPATAKLEDPTQLADRIFRIGAASLLKKEADGTKFRLIGIGVSDLCDAGRAPTRPISSTRRPAAARRAKPP